MTAIITVLIPKHCSILKYFHRNAPAINYNTDQGIVLTKNELEGSVTGSKALNTKVLPIQVGREGIVSRELQQLFMANDKISLREKAISIISQHFEKYIFDAYIDSYVPPIWKKITQLHQNGNELCEELDNMTEGYDKAHTLSTDSQENLMTKDLFDSFFISTFLMKARCSKIIISDAQYRSTIRQKENQSKLFLFIFPPHPTPSRFESSDLYPEKLFSSALIKLENLQIRLQTLNAYIATLGGGYFLCRYLSTAVRLARYQRQVALALQDINLAAKCTINEAYNYIHYGMVDHALVMIQKVKAEAKQRSDNLTVSMCKSAILFAKRLAKAQKHEDEVINSQKKLYYDVDNSSTNRKKSNQNDHSDNHIHKTNGNSHIVPSVISETVDDFQRIRIVRDKKKKQATRL